VARSTINYFYIVDDSSAFRGVVNQGAGNDEAAFVAIGSMACTFNLEHKEKRVVAAFISDDEGFLAHGMCMGHTPSAFFSPQESMDAILDDLKVRKACGC
jgi:hypothetical protein